MVQCRRFWDGVLGPDPGYKACGYTSTDSCANWPTAAGSCDDHEHYFYWIPGLSFSHLYDEITSVCV